MILRIAASVFLLATAVSAQIVAPQPLSVTGVVRALPALPGPPILCAPGTHEIECAEGIFQIQSDTLILSALEGKNVKLTMVSAAVGCPLYNVTAVDLTPPATLELCGTGGFGCPVRLVSGPGGISQHFLFGSVQPSLISAGVPAGSLLLGQPLVFLGVGFGSGPEGVIWDFTVPSNASLLGVTAYVQVARRDVGPVGPIRWSNARCLEIVGNVLVCHPADCAIAD